ncbi:MAG: glycosyl transferase, family 4 [Nitrospira sp.]|nr:glycosyl transferase, family 4 [Nitrospira sp.]
MITPFMLSAFACMASVCLTEIVRRLASRVGAVDLPSDRKMHSHPVPRLGGVAVVGAIALTYAAAGLTGLSEGFLERNALSSALLMGGALMFICGLWDDLSPIPARTKFIVQLTAAIVALSCGLHFDKVTFAGDYSLDLGIISIPITILWIVGITNAFNLIDGLDGLSAGLGCIAAATCAAIFFHSGAVDDATMLLVVFGALAGFLPYNFNPAKIFLGDSGSLVLGYVLAVMVVSGSQRYATATAVIIPLLTLGVPIVDTLLSFVRRMLTCRFAEHAAGSWRRSLVAVKQIFVADRDHIHHRLLASGLTHRGAVLALYAVAGTWSTLAYLSAISQFRNALLLLVSAAVATAIGVARLGYFDAAVSRLGSAFEQVDRPKFDRSFFFGFADLLLITVAYWSAYFIIAGPDAPTTVRQWYVNMFPLVALLQLCLFWITGLYRGLWRAIGIDDLLRVAIAVSAGGVLSFSFVIVNHAPDGIGSLFVVHTLTLGWLMGGLRSAYRLVDYSRFKSVAGSRPVLIYGAGLGGRLLLRELRQNAAYRFHAVGFIDDDRRLRGQLISGLPVLGTLRDLPSSLCTKHIHTVLISTQAITGEALQETLDTCHAHGTKVLRGHYGFESVETDRRRTPRRFPEVDQGDEIRRLRYAIASLRKTAM